MEQCFKQKSSFRTIRILLFSLSMLFAYVANGFAQNTVKGVVTDVNGDPLPGVSVVVKSTTTGTTTDIDGKYSISAPSAATLEFSYIGMNKQEVKVNGRSTINIILKEDVANLDEHGFLLFEEFGKLQFHFPFLIQDSFLGNVFGTGALKGSANLKTS